METRRHSRKRRSCLLVASLPLLLTPHPAQAQCEVDQLIDPGGDPDNGFGIVAIDGDVAIIGDPNWPGPGRAWAFRRIRGQWQPEQELVTPFSAPSDNFGLAVAVDGTLAVVGAPYANATEISQGAVDVFRWQPSAAFANAGGQWVHETRLLAQDGGVMDELGWSVAVDGEAVVAGARGDGEGLFVGSAYVFRYRDGQWAQEAKFTDPEGQEFDGFGVSVAVSGDTALVGAHGNDEAGFGTGAVFAFVRRSGTWSLETQLNAEDALYQAWFGFSVALEGDVAAIGAPEDNGDNGAVYIFRRFGPTPGDLWTQEAKLTAARPVGPFPFLGGRVALNPQGAIVVAGAPGDYEEGLEAGAAHVFRHLDGQWIETAKLFQIGAAPGRAFGSSVAVSDDSALIRSSGATGVAHAFEGVAGIDCNHNGKPDACDIFFGGSEDLDHDGVPDECQRPDADLDGDGDIDFADLVLLLHLWGPCPPAASACVGDIDGDGHVGLPDLLILLIQWD